MLENHEWLIKCGSAQQAETISGWWSDKSTNGFIKQQKKIYFFSLEASLLSNCLGGVSSRPGPKRA